MGNKAVFSGVQWSRRDVDHSPLFSAKVKNEWSFTLLPLYAFMSPIGTTSSVPDIIKGSFFPHAEFLSSTIVTVYINTTKKLVFTIYGILTWLCHLNSAVILWNGDVLCFLRYRSLNLGSCGVLSGSTPAWHRETGRISGGWSDTRTGFSPTTSAFILQYHCTIAPILFNHSSITNSI